MTELLQQAIAEIQKLPADQQDAIASRLMAELKDEQRWTEQFASTTDEQWDQLADLVRQDIASGNISPINKFISSNVTNRIGTISNQPCDEIVPKKTKA